LKDLLFKTVQKRVLTWQGKLILSTIFTLLLISLWVSREFWLKTLVNAYIVDEIPTSYPHCEHLVVENWTGDYEIFVHAKTFAEKTGAKTIVSTMYESIFNHPRLKQATLLNAWSAELDTTTLVFFVVPFSRAENASSRQSRYRLCAPTRLERIFARYTRPSFAPFKALLRKIRKTAWHYRAYPSVRA
jgi:hypothetical protein